MRWATALVFGLIMASVSDAATYSSVGSGTWSTTGSSGPWGSTTTVAPGGGQQIITGSAAANGMAQLVLAGQYSPAWVVGDKLQVSGVPLMYNLNSAPHTYYTVTAVSTTLVAGSTVLVLNVPVPPLINASSASIGTPVVTRFDSVTINSGHTVTVGSSTSVGTMSTGTTWELIVYGNLSVGGGVDFVVRTGMYLSGSLTVAGGSTLEYDSPAGGSYYSRMNSGCSVSVVGGAGSPVTIKSSNPSSMVTGFRAGGPANSIVFQYAYFQNMINPLTTYGTDPYVQVANSVFLGCQNAVGMETMMLPSSTYLLQSNYIYNSVNSKYALNLYAGTTPLTPNPVTGQTAQRVISGCYFDQAVVFNSPTNNGASGFQMTQTFFAGGLVVYGAGPWTSFDQNVYVQTNVDLNILALGPITNSIIVTDNATGFDPNVIEIAGSSPTSNMVSGCIYQANTTGNNGAFVYVENFASNPLTPVTLAVTNNLVLPNLNPATPGASASLFILVSSEPNIKVTIEHNTSDVDAGTGTLGLVYVGDEGTDVSAGQITSLRSNLAYASKPAPANTSNLILLASDTVTTLNVAPPSMVGWNGGFNLSSSSTAANTTKTGYLTETGVLFSTVPAANTTDVEQDPAFVDKTRDLATAYVKYFGGTTTGTAVGDMRATLAQLSENPTQTQAVINWIRAGWTPTNVNYKAAAHDGTTIGAAQMK